MQKPTWCILAAMFVLVHAVLPASPAALDTGKISVPDALGAVQERHTGDPGKPAVIHIRDVHCNLEVQTAIASMIERFVRENGINAVALEGANGSIDVAPFTDFPRRQARQEVAAAFLRNGDLSGTEYAAITAEVPFDVIGIETPDLYRENYRAFQDSYAELPKISGAIDALYASFTAYRRLLATESANTYLERMYAYRTKQLPFTDYCAYLIDLCADASIALGQFPAFEAFARFQQTAKDFQLETVTQETAEIVDIATQFLEGESKANLLQAHLQYQFGQLTAVEYYTTLSGVMTDIELDPMDYPHTSAYVSYLKSSQSVDYGALRDEYTVLSDVIEVRLLTTEHEQLLRDGLVSLALLDGMSQLRLSHDDLRYTRTNRDRFTGAYFRSLFARLSAQAGLSAPPAEHFDAIQKSLPAFESFYEAGKKRDRILTQNLLAVMEEKSLESAVVVAGGFHTEGMTEYLRAHGYSYVVINPRVHSAQGRDVYLAKMLRSKNSFVDQLLAGNQLAVESILQRNGMVFSPAELAAYRSAFNAYLLAYAAHQVGEEELLTQTFAGFEDMVKQDVFKKLQPAIANRLGDEVGQWINDHFEELTDYQIEMLSEQDIRVTLQIRSREYSILVSRSELAGQSAGTTLVRLDPLTMMVDATGVGALSEFVPVTANIAGADAGVAALARSLSVQVQAPLRNNHRQFTTAEFLALLESQPEIHQQVGELLRDNAVNEVWIEEGVPAEVFASFIGAMANTNQADRPTLSKKLVILENFSHGLSITTSLEGRNQLNLYSVPHLITQNGQRGAELVTPQDQEALRELFMALPAGTMGDAQTLPVNTVVDTLTQWMPTDLNDEFPADYTAVVDEITQMLKSGSPAYQQRFIQKYKSIQRDNRSLREDVIIAFQVALNNLLIQDGAMLAEHRETMNNITGYVFTHYGLEKVVAIASFFRGNPVQFTETVLMGEKTLIENYRAPGALPLAFTADEMSLGWDIIKDLVKKNLTNVDFIDQLDKTLYNSWISSEERHRLIADLVELLQQIEKTALLTEVYKMLARHNNNEVNIPPLAVKSFSGKLFTLAKRVIATKQLAPNIKNELLDSAIALDDKAELLGTLKKNPTPYSYRILETFLDSSPAIELRGIAINAFFETMSQILADGKLEEARAHQALDKMMEHLRTSSYVDERYFIIHGLGELIKRDTIAWSVRGRALILLETFQNSPDMTIANSSRQTLKNGNGYEQLIQLRELISNGGATAFLPLLMDSMGDIERLQPMQLTGVDRVAFDIAINAFEASGEPGIIFELAEAPSIENFKRMSTLAHEVLVFRNRTTGAWYAVNGATADIRSHIFLYLGLTGKVDFALHNHPNQPVPRPSNVDLVEGAKFIEHSYVIGLDGIAKIGTVTKLPYGRGPARPTWTSFEKVYYDWLDSTNAIEIEPIKRAPLFYKKFGVDYEYSPWDQVADNEFSPPSKTLYEMMRSDSPHVQAIAADAFNAFGYPDLLNAVNFIHFMNDVFKDNEVDFLRLISHKAENHYIDRMTEFQEMYLFRMNLVNGWLEELKTFTIQLAEQDPSMRLRAENINTAILDFQELAAAYTSFTVTDDFATMRQMVASIEQTNKQLLSQLGTIYENFDALYLNETEKLESQRGEPYARISRDSAQLMDRYGIRQDASSIAGAAVPENIVTLQTMLKHVRQSLNALGQVDTWIGDEPLRSEFTAKGQVPAEERMNGFTLSANRLLLNTDNFRKRLFGVARLVYELDLFHALEETNTELFDALLTLQFTDQEKNLISRIRELTGLPQKQAENQIAELGLNPQDETAVLALYHLSQIIVFPDGQILLAQPGEEQQADEFFSPVNSTARLAYLILNMESGGWENVLSEAFKKPFHGTQTDQILMLNILNDVIAFDSNTRSKILNLLAQSLFEALAEQDLIDLRNTGTVKDFMQTSYAKEKTGALMQIIGRFGLENSIPLFNFLQAQDPAGIERIFASPNISATYLSIPVDLVTIDFSLTRNMMRELTHTPAAPAIFARSFEQLVYNRFISAQERAVLVAMAVNRLELAGLDEHLNALYGILETHARSHIAEEDKMEFENAVAATAKPVIQRQYESFQAPDLLMALQRDTTLAEKRQMIVQLFKSNEEMAYMSLGKYLVDYDYPTELSGMILELYLEKISDLYDEGQLSEAQIITIESQLLGLFKKSPHLIQKQQLLEHFGVTAGSASLPLIIRANALMALEAAQFGLDSPVQTIARTIFEQIDGYRILRDVTQRLNRAEFTEDTTQLASIFDSLPERQDNPLASIDRLAFDTAVKIYAQAPTPGRLFELSSLPSSRQLRSLRTAGDHLTIFSTRGTNRWYIINGFSDLSQSTVLNELGQQGLIDVVVTYHPLTAFPTPTAADIAFARYTDASIVIAPQGVAQFGQVTKDPVTGTPIRLDEDAKVSFEYEYQQWQESKPDPQLQPAARIRGFLTPYGINFAPLAWDAVPDQITDILPPRQTLDGLLDSPSSHQRAAGVLAVSQQGYPRLLNAIDRLTALNDIAVSRQTGFISEGTLPVEEQALYQALREINNFQDVLAYHVAVHEQFLHQFEQFLLSTVAQQLGREVDVFAIQRDIGRIHAIFESLDMASIMEPEIVVERMRELRKTLNVLSGAFFSINNRMEILYDDLVVINDRQAKIVLQYHDTVIAAHNDMVGFVELLANIPAAPDDIANLQAHLNPTLTVAGQPAVGPLLRNGETTVEGITRDLVESFDLLHPTDHITLRINQSEISLIFEQSIMTDLGFETREQFQKFLTAGLELRGKELYDTLPDGQIILGKVDRSLAPFVDEKKNRFIGVNKAFLSAVDSRFLRQAFLVGFTHEMRHEAGIFIDGMELLDPEKIERHLTAEDAVFTGKLINDYDGYRASLEQVLQSAQEGQPDYLREIQTADAASFVSPFSDIVTGISQPDSDQRTALIADLEAVFLNQPSITPDLLDTIRQVSAVYPEQSANIASIFADVITRKLQEDTRLFALFKDQLDAMITVFIQHFGAESGIMLFTDLQSMNRTEIYEFMQSETTRAGISIPLAYIAHDRIPLDQLVRVVLAEQPDIEQAAYTIGSVIYNPALSESRRTELFEQSLTIARFVPELKPLMYRVIGIFNAHGFELEGFDRLSTDDQEDYVQFIYNQAVKPISDYLKEKDSTQLDPEALHDALETSLSDPFANYILRDQKRGNTQRMQAMNTLFDLWADESLTESSVYRLAEHLKRNEIHPELEGIAAAMLVERLGRVVRGQTTFDIDNISMVFDTVLDLFTRSRLEEGKTTVLSMLGVLLRKKDLPIGLSGRAIQFIDAVSTSADIALRYKAWNVFYSADGDWWLEQLKDKIDANAEGVAEPEFYQWREKIFQTVYDHEQLLMPIDFETAFDIFQSERISRIQFKLNAPPTNQQLKLLEQLDYEILVTRERTDGQWLITRGGAETVSSGRLNNRVYRGEIDVTGHNHPLPSPATPSRADLFFGNEPEYNFIFGKHFGYRDSGFTMWGIVSKDIDTQDPSNIAQFESLDDMKDQWKLKTDARMDFLKALSQKRGRTFDGNIPYHASMYLRFRMYEELGVDLESTLWTEGDFNDVIPPQPRSLLELLTDSHYSNQIQALKLLRRYRYPNIVGARDLIRRVVFMSDNAVDPKVRAEAASTVSHFAREMQIMERSYNVQLAKLEQWLQSVQLYLRLLPDADAVKKPALDAIAKLELHIAVWGGSVYTERDDLLDSHKIVSGNNSMFISGLDDIFFALDQLKTGKTENEQDRIERLMDEVNPFLKHAERFAGWVSKSRLADLFNNRRSGTILAPQNNKVKIVAGQQRTQRALKQSWKDFSNVSSLFLAKPDTTQGERWGTILQNMIKYGIVNDILSGELDEYTKYKLMLDMVNLTSRERAMIRALMHIENNDRRVEFLFAVASDAEIGPLFAIVTMDTFFNQANAILARNDIDEYGQMTQLARLIVQSGIYYDLKTNPKINLFDVLLKLNFSEYDRIVLKTLRDHPDAPDFPAAKKFNLFVDMADAHQATVNKLTDISDANSLQVTLKQGLTANGVSAVGPVSRNGSENLAQITEDVQKDAAVIPLTIAGKQITIAVENAIIQQLGFTDPSQFADMISLGIQLRGEEFYTALPEGKQIVLGIVDTSESLFVDHVNNGFIGVNGAFFEHLDTQYQREMAMIGFTHELLHEAGVGAEGEFLLTMQDTALAAQLFSDKDAFLAALAVLVDDNSSDEVDFYRTVSAVSAQEFNAQRAVVQTAVESAQLAQLAPVVAQLSQGTEEARAQASAALQTAIAFMPDQRQNIINGITDAMRQALIDGGMMNPAQQNVFTQTMQSAMNEFGIPAAVGIVNRFYDSTPQQTAQLLESESIIVDDVQVPVSLIGEQMVPMDRAVQSIFNTATDTEQIIQQIQFIVTQNSDNPAIGLTAVSLAAMLAESEPDLQTRLMQLLDDYTLSDIAQTDVVTTDAAVVSESSAQGELRADVVVAGQPISGQLNRNGKTVTGDIVLDILETSKEINLRVNGKILKLHVEQDIIDALQFRTEDEFTAFLMRGIQLRGQELFTSLAFDKQIVVGFVDTSESLVEDHEDNNFMGINRAFKDVLDQRYMRELFLVGFTHELRHEAGITMDNEEQLIAEDITLTHQLVDDKDAFVNALSALFSDREPVEGTVDYLTRLKQQDAGLFVSPVNGIVGLFDDAGDAQTLNVTRELQNLFLQSPDIQQETLARYDTALALYPELQKGLSKKILEFLSRQLVAQGVLSTDAAAQFTGQFLPIATQFGVTAILQFSRTLDTIPFDELFPSEEKSVVQIAGIRLPISFIEHGIIDDTRLLNMLLSESIDRESSMVQLQTALYHAGITQARRNEIIEQALVRVRGIQALEARVFPVLANNNTFGFNSQAREQSYYAILDELRPLLIQRRAIPRINQYIETSVTQAVGTETEIIRLWLSTDSGSLRELMGYVRDDISYDRQGIGAAVLIEKLAHMTQFNPSAVSSTDAGAVFETVFDIFADNKTEEGKMLILTMLGVVANNTSLPWIIRGKAIQFIEAAQSISGTTVSNFARDVFARSGGADIMDELETFIASPEGAPYLQDFISEVHFANRMSDRTQFAVDTVNFDVALALFKQYEYTRVTFELPASPTKEQLKRLVPLAFEVLVYRERASGKWFIMRGSPDQVGSKFMINNKRQANIDVSIHNHPGESIPYPSDPDLVFGNMIENNFIVGRYHSLETGMTQFGIVRRNPETGDPARVSTQPNAQYRADVFYEQIGRINGLYQKTLREMVSSKGITLDDELKNLLFELSAYQMYELFDVEIDPRQWSDVNLDDAIPSSQSMRTLLFDSSAHNQAFAIEAILAYGYADLIPSTDIFERISRIYEQTDVEYLRILAGNALDHFRREMESFDRTVRVQLSLTGQWVKSVNAFARTEIMPQLDGAQSTAFTSALASLAAIVDAYMGQPVFADLDAIDETIDGVWHFVTQLEKQLPVIQQTLSEAQGLSTSAQQQNQQFIDNAQTFLQYARRVQQWYEASRLQDVFADKAATQPLVPQDQLVNRRKAVRLDQIESAAEYSAFRRLVNDTLSDKYLVAEERWQVITALAVQHNIASRIAGNTLDAREVVRTLIDTDTTTARERAILRILYHLHQRPTARQEQLRFINAIAEQQEVLPLIHLVDMLHGSLAPHIENQISKRKIGLRDGRVRVTAGSILPYPVNEYSSVKLHLFLEKGNEVLAQNYPPQRQWKEIAQLIKEYGLYDAVISQRKDIFPFILALNLSPDDFKTIADLQTMRVWSGFGDAIAKPALWLKMVANPSYKPYRSIYDFAMGRIDPAVFGDDFSVKMFQARLNPDLTVNDESAVGQLSKNGKTSIPEIVTDIQTGASSTVILNIADTSVTVQVENALIEKLGFTGSQAVEDFKQFLLRGIQTRGENLFAGFAVGEQITLGIVDQSDTPFVDHADNGFIGVNRSFFEAVSADFQRPLFLVGVTHELRHESGVEAENLNAEEIMLTEEDVRMTGQLVANMDGLMDNLGQFLIQKPEGAIDYLGQLRADYRIAVTDEASISIAQAVRLLRAADADQPDAQIMADITAFFAGMPVMFDTDILTTYSVVQSVYPDTSARIIEYVAQAAAEQLVLRDALSDTDQPAFISHLTTILTAYGIEQSIPIFLHFYDQTPADTARIIQSVEVGVDGMSLPVDFIGAGIISGETVLSNLMAQDISAAEFTEKLRELLYNRWITQQQRDQWLAHTIELLNTQGTFDSDEKRAAFTTAAYQMVSRSNNNEVGPRRRTEPVDYFALYQQAQRYFEEGTPVEQLFAVLQDTDRPFEEQQAALVILGAGFSKEFTPIPPDNLAYLLHYINQGVPYELSELTITILGANAQILAENVAVERSDDINAILGTLFDHVGRSRYFLQRIELITQIADIAANESISWSIRAKALLFLQALQQSPDKSIGHILSAQSRRINQPDLLRQLRDQLAAGTVSIPVDDLIGAVAASDGFISFNSQGIDTVDLQTALQIFKTDPEPKTIFKLPGKPTKSDIEALRALDFETLLYRERMTDNWYIVRGEAKTVGGERYKVIRALGDMDVTIHNHPIGSAVLPSQADITSASFVEQNFITGKAPFMVEYGQVTRNPFTGEPVQPTGAEINDLIAQWRADLEQQGLLSNRRIEYLLQLHNAFGIQYAPVEFEGEDVDSIILPTRSFWNLLYDPSPHMQAIALISLSQSDYSSLAAADEIVSFVNEMATQSPHDFIRSYARTVTENYTSQMNSYSTDFDLHIQILKSALTEFDRFNTQRLSATLDAESRRQVNEAVQRIRTIINAYGAPKPITTLIDGINTAEWIQATLKELTPAIKNLDYILAQAGEFIFTTNPAEFSETQKNMQQFADLNKYFVRVNGWYVDSEFIRKMGTPADTEKPAPLRERSDEIVREFIQTANRVLEFTETSDDRLTAIARVAYSMDIHKLANGNPRQFFGYIQLLNLNETDREEIGFLSSFASTGLFTAALETSVFDGNGKELLRAFYNLAHDQLQANDFDALYALSNWQALMRPDLQVDGQSVIGPIARNGQQGLPAVMDQIRSQPLRDVVLTIDGKQITLQVEAAILDNLGFSGDTAVEEFARFIKTGIELRGEQLYRGFQNGEKILFGIVDQTERSLFVDKKDNGFMGINRAFFALMNPAYARQAFLVGVTHELRHEAGVYLGANRVLDSLLEEEILTQEDVHFTRQLVANLDDYLAALNVLLIGQAEGVTDYFAQLQQASKERRQTDDPGIPDAAVNNAINATIEEVGGKQFYTVYSGGEGIGKVGKALTDTINELSGVESLLIRNAMEFLQQQLSILSIPAPDGSIGVYRQGTRLKLSHTDIDPATGLVTALYLGKGMVEELIDQEAGLNEFLVFEGVKAYAVQRVILGAEQGISADALADDFQSLGMQSFADQIRSQAQLFAITTAQDVRGLLFGTDEQAVNVSFKTALFDALAVDAHTVQQQVTRPDKPLAAIKDQLVRNNKTEAVTYVLDRLAKQYPDKAYLYVQFKNMERANQQAVIQQLQGILGTAFDTDIRDAAQTADEIIVSLGAEVLYAIERTVEANLPVVFIVPKSFYQATVTQRNWNMSYFMEQFKAEQQTQGRFVVFVAVDTDPADPFGLMVNMNIKGVEGTDVDYVHRAENVSTLLQTLNKRFPQSRMKLVDLPGGVTGAQAREYARTNDTSLEVLPVEDEQFFFDALQTSVFVTGVRDELPIAEQHQAVRRIVDQFKQEELAKFKTVGNQTVAANDILLADRMQITQHIDAFLDRNTALLEQVSVQYLGNRIQQAAAVDAEESPEAFVARLEAQKREAIRTDLFHQYQLTRLKRLYDYFSIEDMEGVFALYKQVRTAYNDQLLQKGFVSKSDFHAAVDEIIVDVSLNRAIKDLNLKQDFSNQLQSVFIAYIAAQSQSSARQQFAPQIRAYAAERLSSIERAGSFSDTQQLIPVQALDAFYSALEGDVLSADDVSYYRQFGHDLFNRTPIVRDAPASIMQRIEKARAYEESA